MFKETDTDKQEGMFTKLKKLVGKNLTPNGQKMKNPNRVQRFKTNLRPDQVKRLNTLKGTRHQIMRRIVDAYFRTVDGARAAEAGK